VLERAVRLVEVCRRSDATEQDVVTVLVEFGEPAPVEVARDDMAALRDVSLSLEALFLEREVGGWASGVNALLAAWDVRPRLEHEGVGWHLHGGPADDDGSWAAWFATTTALAVAVHIAETGRPVGGTCAAPGCDRLFLDPGRGVARRFCSERCASRSRVSAHRARRP
jgi:hypothetical protein